MLLRALNLHQSGLIGVADIDGQSCHHQCEGRREGAARRSTMSLVCLLRILMMLGKQVPVEIGGER